MGNGKWSATGSIANTRKEPGENFNGPDEAIEPSFWEGIHSAVNESSWPSRNPVDDHYDHIQGVFRGNSKRDLARAASLGDLVSGQSNELNDEAEAHIAAMQEERRLRTQLRDMGYVPDDEVEEHALGVGIDDERDDAPHSAEYDEYLEKYGVDCAEAYDAIDAFITDMEGCDEGLLDIARQAYGLMSEQGRSELETNGF